MTDFENWCDPLATESVKGHTFGLLTSTDDELGIAAVAATLGEKYAAADTLIHIADKLGKQKVSAFLSNKFPTKKTARSGDMGEILATAYLHEDCGYAVGPSRLIDRDHQEWAMRGDDVLGVKIDSGSGVHLAKVEAKSRKRMSKAVVAEAREGLQRSDGLPSPHSLSQFVERLRRVSAESLADAVLHAQLCEEIRPEMVTHVMFLFTMNDPSKFVKDDLKGYTGAVKQLALALRVKAHPQFIGQAYQKALDVDA
ncbi:Hachiman antiphage defense system protein HamA [Mycolicibacterium sp. lyk4-40-TYG-92]|uniref:Hachiman antiphage defense system protein HamA n=1 Tax=Mycolicibacterium sp. lyk4-40-TYG-92 TaxID=3040295 RepID=UPI00254A9E66|nr:Hachiman antiphage defense system protein HamA [Mycolicibacterium sp. lyk4-40-TYG-92]